MSDIKENLKNLIGEDTSREVIEKIAVISNQVDEMIEQSAKQAADYKELLNDYAKLVKSSVFQVDNQSKVDEGTKEFSFDSFVATWQDNKAKKL